MKTFSRMLFAIAKLLDRAAWQCTCWAEDARGGDEVLS